MNLWDKYNSVINILTKAEEAEKLATLRHVVNLIDEGKINLVDKEFNPVNWKEQPYLPETDPDKVILNSMDEVFRLIEFVVGRHYLTPETRELIETSLRKDIEKNKDTSVMEYYYFSACLTKLIQISMETRSQEHLSDK